MLFPCVSIQRAEFWCMLEVRFIYKYLLSLSLKEIKIKSQTQTNSTISGFLMDYLDTVRCSQKSVRSTEIYCVASNQPSRQYSMKRDNSTKSQRARARTHTHAHTHTHTCTHTHTHTNTHTHRHTHTCCKNTSIVVKRFDG